MNSILIIGQLLNAVGEIEGRKKFQKLVHILQHFGIPFGFRFGYLHYGPYSGDLQSQLETFENEDLIKEQAIQTGMYPTSLFSAQDKLKHLVERLVGGKVLSWTGLAKELNDLPTQELEAISTIYYLRSSGKKDGELKDSFCSLKPKFATVFDQRLKTANDLERKYKKAA